jgi:hypothetical protein
MLHAAAQLGSHACSFAALLTKAAPACPMASAAAKSSGPIVSSLRLLAVSEAAAKARHLRKKSISRSETRTFDGLQQQLRIG